MAKIKIKTPETKLLHQETRLNYLTSIQSSEMNFYESALIQADSAIVYKKELFHQDKIKIELYIDDIHNYGFDFIYIFKKEETEVARIKTGMIFFNYEEKKIQRTSEVFIQSYQ